MEHVTSADGTRIAYDRVGSGPAVLIIGAGPVTRASNAPLADLLAEHFTVYLYDRRGRGDSDDTHPYAAEREFEDMAAIVDRAGGSAMVYGDSGGAIIALQAAAHGLPFTRLGLWEPPYILPGVRTVPHRYRERQWELREQGRGSDMLELFFTGAVGMPEEMVAGMKAAPFWEGMAGAVGYLAYDAELIGDFSIPREQLKSLTVPVHLINGTQMPWIVAACEELAGILADVSRATLDGEPHNVDPAALAPELTRFFREGAGALWAGSSSSTTCRWTEWCKARATSAKTATAASSRAAGPGHISASTPSTWPARSPPRAASCLAG